MSTLLAITAVLFAGTLIYFAALSIWYVVLMITTFPDLLNRFRESQYGNLIKLINIRKQIPVTVVTPVYNEEKRIINMVYSVLQSDYKNTKLILVNDGSEDNTMKILRDEFDLYEIPYAVNEAIETCQVLGCYQSAKYEQLTVIDKEHTPFHCAADALNAGLNACTSPLMLTVDADTLVEPEAISRLLFTFLSNNHCVAVGGCVYVLNESRIEHGRMLDHKLPSHMITAVQGVEYLRSFLFARSGMNAFSGALCFSGAFSFFETQVLREVGGFDRDNYAYDAEIIMKLHHRMRKNNYPYKVIYTSSAFCWTEVPSTLKSYWKQRDTWQRGMLRSIQRHMAMFFNPRYGIVGMLTFPLYVLFEVFAPIVELMTYVLLIICLCLGQLSLMPFVWLILLAWGLVTLITLVMSLLDLLSFNKYKKGSDVLKAVWVVLYEMFGFRQYRALCCTISTVKYFFRRIFGRPL